MKMLKNNLDYFINYNMSNIISDYETQFSENFELNNIESFNSIIKSDSIKSRSVKSNPIKTSSVKNISIKSSKKSEKKRKISTPLIILIIVLLILAGYAIYKYKNGTLDIPYMK